jgi:hypothetical protein
MWVVVFVWPHGARVGGSGWVAVGRVDLKSHGGSNGGGYNVAVAVLREIWKFENVSNFFNFFFSILCVIVVII